MTNVLTACSYGDDAANVDDDSFRLDCRHNGLLDDLHGHTKLTGNEAAVHRGGRPDGGGACDVLREHEQKFTAAINAGVSVPSMSGSLAYFDTYRRARSPANLVQAQRDFFGSHTYERTDMEGWYHTLWSDMNSADSITTSGYKA